MAYNDLTNMLTVNPWMFDPSQLSNQFSNYNNQRMPGPSYNPGLAGGPVNAATGQPIASYQQWAQANPAGMTLNQTPAQPQAPSSNQDVYNQVMQSLAQRGMFNTPDLSGSGSHGPSNMSWQRPPGSPVPTQPQQAAPQAQAQGQPGAWQAALNALARPGDPQTLGANVPLATGFQPSGGVNNAWLQGIGSGQGMNMNFINALRNIQARPQ